MTCIIKNQFKNFELITFIEHIDNKIPFFGITFYKKRKKFQFLKQHLFYHMRNTYNTEFIWHIGNIVYYIVIREIDKKHSEVIYDNELEIFNTFLNNYIKDLKILAEEEADY